MLLRLPSALIAYIVSTCVFAQLCIHLHLCRNLQVHRDELSVLSGEQDWLAEQHSTQPLLGKYTLLTLYSHTLSGNSLSFSLLRLLDFSKLLIFDVVTLLNRNLFRYCQFFDLLFSDAVFSVSIFLTLIYSHFIIKCFFSLIKSFFDIITFLRLFRFRFLSLNDSIAVHFVTS